jgi:Zn-finger nucleic acid-binding protein
MVEHISKGVGRPFAGISNDITFPDIIDGSINFLPVEIPGIDQKQELVDNNINYISMYDGTPVMETMYVNAEDYTQLSFLHNIMGVQEVIKAIRTRCPRIRYTFLDGSDLETYIEDVQQIITQYSTNFKSITCEYMADEKYEQNNIFYAVLKVQFKNFDQEEYFKIIAIS